MAEKHFGTESANSTPSGGGRLDESQSGNKSDGRKNRSRFSIKAKITDAEFEFRGSTLMAAGFAGGAVLAALAGIIQLINELLKK